VETPPSILIERKKPEKRKRTKTAIKEVIPEKYSRVKKRKKRKVKKISCQKIKIFFHLEPFTNVMEKSF
jgi:hypothetical protein